MSVIHYIVFFSLAVHGCGAIETYTLVHGNLREKIVLHLADQTFEYYAQQGHEQLFYEGPMITSTSAYTLKFPVDYEVNNLSPFLRSEITVDSFAISSHLQPTVSIRVVDLAHEHAVIGAVIDHRSIHTTTKSFSTDFDGKCHLNLNNTSTHLQCNAPGFLPASIGFAGDKKYEVTIKMVERQSLGVYLMGKDGCIFTKLQPEFVLNRISKDKLRYQRLNLSKVYKRLR